MGSKYDAIIIGAGVIGSAVGFELAKRGMKTINVDKLAAAGYGSTGNTCAIIRTHYSTYEGVAMAYEGYHHWKDWGNYLGVGDEKGLIKFHETGCLMIEGPESIWPEMRKNFTDVGVPFEEMDLNTAKDRFGIFDFHSFWPPARPEDPSFFQERTAHVNGAVYYPCAGYINDPQLSTHNLQRAAESKGGTFLFNSEITEIRQTNNRVNGVTLANGQTIDAPVVVNVAGPHSFVINRMAGVEEDMTVKTRALRHEVHHIPSPEGFDFEKNGIFTTDGDSAIYFRPEVGNMILVGSEDPECDTQEWVENPDEFNREITDSQYRAQAYRLARRIHELSVPNKPLGIADLYDCSDDWIPIYDKSSLDGFYMAVGTSGNQYKNATIAAFMMGEIIAACENGRDHDGNPVEIICPCTKLALNSGFYSRNRKINANSSFSVRG